VIMQGDGAPADSQMVEDTLDGGEGLDMVDYTGAIGYPAYQYHFHNNMALTDGNVGGGWNQSVDQGSNLAWASGTRPYLEVDLGSVQAIDSIALWGQADNPGLSDDLRVYVSEAAFVSTATAYTDLAGASNVTKRDVAEVDTNPVRRFTDTLSGIESVIGTALADSLTGDGNNNQLDGGMGNDSLDGGAGDDAYVLNLGGGQDHITDASGSDSIVFGAGITAAQVSASMVNGRVTLSLASGESISFAASAIGSYAVERFNFFDSVRDATWLNGLLNVAPAGANKTVTLNEDGSYTITAADLGFSDANAGDSLSAVRIDSLPAAGSLKYGSMNVTVGQVFNADALATGWLMFSPASNANGNNYASFTFSVKDQFGAFDAAPNTLGFNVTPVNDAPTLTAFGVATGRELDLKLDKLYRRLSWSCVDEKPVTILKPRV
jgi:hypothetical protein